MKANTGSGDAVGVSGATLGVPFGYVSGNPLSDTMTFNGATFTSLGGNARHLQMDVGDWITEPEFHAPDWTGYSS
jgi:hypothetical protein